MYPPEDDDTVADRDTGRRFGRGNRLLRDLSEAGASGLSHAQCVSSGADEVPEHSTGLDRRELLRVTDEDQSCVGADCFE